jgi:hypothetical protein
MKTTDYKVILDVRRKNMKDLCNLINEINNLERELDFKVKSEIKEGIISINTKYFKNNYKEINSFENKLKGLDLNYETLKCQ